MSHPPTTQDTRNMTTAELINELKTEHGDPARHMVNEWFRTHLRGVQVHLGRPPRTWIARVWQRIRQRTIYASQVYAQLAPLIRDAYPAVVDDVDWTAVTEAVARPIIADRNERMSGTDIDAVLHYLKEVESGRPAKPPAGYRVR